MKKILLIILMFCALPVMAACPITGCSAPINFESNSLKEKFVPNNLKNIQRTDAFQPQIVEPFGTNIQTKEMPHKIAPESGNFEDCLFGDCLQDK